MQITLNHDEILDALDMYVRTQIALTDDQRIEIDLKAGRGENGFSATLDIVRSTDKGAPTKAVIKAVTPASMTLGQTAPFNEPEAGVLHSADESDDEDETDEAPATKSIFSKG